MAAFGLLAAAVFGAVEPNVTPAADPAGVSAAAQSIAAAIEQGRWDQAADLIDRQGDAVRPALRPMADVLEQYQALRQQRQQDRQAVFNEQSAALETLLSGRAAGDPNATDHAVLAQARRLWGDASEAEQADLLARSAIRSMLDDARQKAADACAAGSSRENRPAEENAPAPECGRDCETTIRGRNGCSQRRGRSGSVEVGQQGADPGQRLAQGFFFLALALHDLGRSPGEEIVVAQFARRGGQRPLEPLGFL